jgi:hypothetical protein
MAKCQCQTQVSPSEKCPTCGGPLCPNCTCKTCHPMVTVREVRVARHKQGEDSVSYPIANIWMM